MTRVLVTGGSGFIGRHALAALGGKVHELHASSRSAPADPPPGVEWHLADLLEPGAADALVAAARPTHLLHCAWFVTPGTYWSAPENVHWVEASLELARSFVHHRGERATFVGSSAEYDWSGGTCSEVSTPLVPATVYGRCKRALGLALEALGESTGTSVAWGRVFFLYGPGEHEARLVPTVTRALLRGEPAPVSSGEQRRDFMHVTDVGAALAALLGSEVEGPVNIASGESVPVRRIVELLAEETGRPELIRWGELASRPGEPALLGADVARLREEVGFTPKIGLREGLREAVDHWRGLL